MVRVRCKPYKDLGLILPDGTIFLFPQGKVCVDCGNYWTEADYIGETREQVQVCIEGTRFWMDRTYVNTHGRIREDEKALLIACKAYRRSGAISQHMDMLARDAGIHPKRAHRILEKWEGKGWWDCGVGMWYGWITSKGMEVVL